MSETLGIALNTNGNFPSQIMGWEFTSFCLRDGVLLATSPTGIHTVETSDTDNGDMIPSTVETMVTDFGIASQKRVRSLYVGYETSGSVELTLTGDDEARDERTYTLDAIPDGQKQHSGKIPTGRDGKARYWGVRVQNVAGCDFSLDSIDAVLIVLGRKPSGG